MKFLLVLFAVTSALHASGQRSRYLPDHAGLQYAGSIGYVSAGAGYDVMRKSARMSFHYGFVPEAKGGRLNIVATKLAFKTMSFRLSERTRINPLDAGIMISYHFGSNFRSRWPNYRYPEGYYWWKTSLRAHLLVESFFTVDLKEKFFKSFTTYVEFNSNDLYIVSYLQNRSSLSLRDIVKIGYGVRMNF
jgi:hypothetical protein